jgi:hypothetical protein
VKNTITLLSLVLLICIMASGCATVYPVGSFYTEISIPSLVGDGNADYSKVGKATAKSYLALIATGDASIEAAAKNGGITDIKYVDYSVKNILGLIGEYTTIVYGD